MNLFTLAILLRNLALGGILIYGLFLCLRNLPRLRSHLKIPLWFASFNVLLVSISTFFARGNVFSFALLNFLLVLGGLLFAALGISIMPSSESGRRTNDASESVRRLSNALKSKAAYVLTAVFIIYSILLFYDLPLSLVRLDRQFLVLNVLMGVEAAINEELFFRLGLWGIFDSYEQKIHLQKIPIIFFTAFLWALFHIDTSFPAGLKFAQIFPFGVALGYLRSKRGFESPLVVHTLFNLVSIGIFSFI